MVGSRVRFVHSADLHIDSLFKTKGHLPGRLLDKLRSSTFEAFDRLIDLCIKHQVDFLLIAGDLYNEEIRSIKAQVHLRRGFERLQQKNIHVYVSYGNHDYIEGNELPIEMPENVHIFSSQNVSYFPFVKEDGESVHIYGFSYETREVRDRKVKSFKKMGEADFHIGMLHGSVDTNTEHNVYAPFSMRELKDCQMDYWALGHIHKRSVLATDPPVIYPGNIQGRSRKESGEKGCYLVESGSGEWDYQFIPLQSFTYESIRMECQAIKEPEHLEKVLEEAKSHVHVGSSVMLTIELVAEDGDLKEWENAGYIKEWVEILNESEDLNAEGWIWIENVTIEDRKSWDETELKRGAHFTGELLRTIDRLREEEIEEWMEPLFSHRKASRYIRSLDDEERKETLERAKVLLLECLMASERGGTK
ncbi:DNA repair exonuclease SbcCD nuclease subunit [Halobacillus karajensis]|uniref:Metallophosphoesterase YhaO n=1 Tax=Halobacillus karajensis TaxID=195088 RepID=A0A059NZK3_9BACI|nr:DNA repair exonuclease [Halobacillus karajensis]CDQ21119.1 putative metallophosphoesterase YhaO [Halobacillus karajensis]CDQ24817.1 putative metallophosphoesterase YhaO [Halobacillus karajensis]CDQ28823.1 putative metallophosphoesterase YhaO [Halobacillus karajensis]SEH96009.1 DNA repair exonuclease SbcCD nuclease subunit [Halobacillus karajensis]